jgi:hypothetical protein
MFISSWLKLKSHNCIHDFSFEDVNLCGGKRGYRNGDSVLIILLLSFHFFRKDLSSCFDEADREHLLLLTTVFIY